MITETLTAEQLDKILSEPGNAVGKVTLELFGFSWAQPAEQPPDCDDMGLYSSTQVLVVYHQDTMLYWWRTVDGTAGTTTYGSIDTGVNISHASIADGEGYVFYAAGAVLYKVNIDTSAITTLYTFDGNILGVGAVSDTEAHIIIDGESSTAQLVYIDGVTPSMSDVYWPWTITRFSAKRLSSGAHDVIVISGRGVSYKSVVAQGVNAAWETKRTTMVAALTYRQGKYSNHYVVESGEDDLNQIIDYGHAFSSAKGVGVVYGISGYGNSMVAMSFSSYGRLWELFTPLRFPMPATSAPHMAVTNKRVFYYGDGLHSSPVNYRFGVNNPDIQYDVTQYVLKGSLNLRVKAGLRELTTEVCPQTEAIIASRQPVMVLFEAGYQYQDDTSQQTLVYIGESDSISIRRDNNGHTTVVINSTDVLAWLDRKSGAYVEFPALEGGYDPYTDYAETGTEYGGMGNTYAVERSWRTPDHSSYGWVLAPSEHADGRVVAFSTLTQNALNGFVQSQVRWEEDSERVGLVARGVMAYILCAAVYEPDNNKLGIVHYTGAKINDNDYRKVVIANVSAALSSPVWLRYAVRYAMHRVYSSTNGIDWTLLLEQVSNWGIYPGSFGVCGEVEAPTPPPGTPYNPPPLPPPWEPPPIEPVPVVEGVAAAFVVFDNFGRARVFVTPNITDLSPTWYDISDTDMDKEPTSLQFDNKTSLNNGLYATIEGNVYYTEDALDIDTYPWAELISPACMLDSNSMDTEWGEWIHSPRAVRRPDSDDGMLINTHNMRDTWGIVYVDGIVSTKTYVGAQYNKVARHLAWYDSDTFFSGHTEIDFDLVYYVFDVYDGDVRCGDLVQDSYMDGGELVDGGPTGLYEPIAELYDGEIWDDEYQERAFGNEPPGAGGSEPRTAVTICPYDNVWHPDDGIENNMRYGEHTIRVELSVGILAHYRLTWELLYRYDNASPFSESDKGARGGGSAGCLAEVRDVVASRLCDLGSAPGDAKGWKVLNTAYANPRFPDEECDGGEIYVDGLSVVQCTKGDNVNYVHHILVEEGSLATPTDMFNACDSELCDTVVECCSPEPIGSWVYCPSWLDEDIPQVVPGIGWITNYDFNDDGELDTVMTTDANDGPCMWPGSRVEDIPINTDNGGYNIIERDGYYAALNRDRDTLYVSEDGFLTNDEIPLPQDLIGDYYPGLDFFYVAGSLYIALYATGGVVVYDVSEGVFSNKTGNLGSLLPLNGYNKYTANGITVKDSDEVPEP